MSSKPLNVAIIGCGVSGIQACKNTLLNGDNITPTVFEQRNDIGGFWHYSPDPTQRSVYQSICVDSGRDHNSWGNLPFKGSDPVVVHNSNMVEYLRKNIKEFNLEKYIRLSTRVDSLDPVDPPPGSHAKAKWRIKSTTKNSDGTRTKNDEIFDGVMICTGRHGRPYIPNFDGMHDFQGFTTHTDHYKNPQKHNLEGKTVVVIGSGNSGADVSTELSRVTKQCYIVSRSGIWAIDVGGAAGYGTLRPDIAGGIFGKMNRVEAAQFNQLSWEEQSSFVEDHYESELQHKLEILRKNNLFPHHRFLSAHPSITGVVTPEYSLYTALETGNLKGKRGIRKILPNGVVFTDGEEIECDAIVYATGYRQAVEFLDPKVVDMRYNRKTDEAEKVLLYRQMFPMNKKYTSLVFINFSQGFTWVMCDVQSNYYLHSLRGGVEFPTEEKMRDHKRRQDAMLEGQYYGSNRHNIQHAMKTDYYDDFAKEIGTFPFPEVVMAERPEAMWAAWYTPWQDSHYYLVGPHRIEETIEWIKDCYESCVGPAPENYLDGEFWAKKMEDDFGCSLSEVSETFLTSKFCGDLANKAVHNLRSRL